MSIREAFINSHVDSCLEKAGGVAAVAPPPSSSSKQRQQQNGRPPASSTAAAGGGGSRAGSASTSNGGLLGGSGGSGGAAVNGFSRLRKGARGSPLEAPPKLCFELMKERDLKAKLAQLGLSTDGNKKVGGEVA
jgi:hypothetical protein